MSRDPTGTAVDPEFGPMRPKPTGCRKGGPCSGGGWVQVGPDYPAKRYPDPPPLRLDATDKERDDHARLCRTRQFQRAAAVDSWYPCKACNGPLFFRWVNGCTAVDHQPCELCATGTRTE